MYKIGIDLGGTKIEGIVLNEKNEEIFRKRIATEQEKGYEHILNNIYSLYQHLLENTKGNTTTLGIGTPGAVSTKTGLLKNSNTTCLNGKNFLADLEKKLQRKIAIQNDANCFAMAEALIGAGENKQWVVGVIMGTGCGGGIVCNEKVLSGKQAIAGEFGHTTLDYKNGALCYCGKKGCVGTYISGSGLENRFLENTGKRISIIEIIELYRKKDEVAKKTMDDFFENFGVAISNLINTLDPDVIVLGGGLSNIDELYTTGIEKVKKYVFNDELLTPIVKNKLGDSAGVFGAALIGIQ